MNESFSGGACPRFFWSKVIDRTLKTEKTPGKLGR